MEPHKIVQTGIPAFAVAFILGTSGSIALGAGAAETYQGKAVKIGKGTAHTFVSTDANGNPVSFGIVFSEKALESLPAATENGHPNFAYPLAMPKQGPRTMVDHVVINWEPKGHPPSKVYDEPHFDFHFYLISRADRMKIKFKSEEESGAPSQQPPPELLPVGYIIPPGTAVPKMGVHAVNPSSDEFHGKPFGVTYIYGYHDKKLVFLEPMASLAFIKSKPDFSAQIPTPSEKIGAYPSSYSLRYDVKNMTYTVSLTDMR